MCITGGHHLRGQVLLLYPQLRGYISSTPFQAFETRSFCRIFVIQSNECHSPDINSKLNLLFLQYSFLSVQGVTFLHLKRFIYLFPPFYSAESILNVSCESETLGRLVTSVSLFCQIDPVDLPGVQIPSSRAKCPCLPSMTPDVIKSA